MRESPRFVRYYRGADAKQQQAYCAHAEMDAIDKATRKFASVDGLDLYVVRYRKDGTPAISKPCIHCMKHIKAANLRRVYYVNESGEWAHLVVSKEA